MKEKKRGCRMRKVLLFFVMAFLSVGVFAQELEYGKVYPLKAGMGADEVMRVMYHNKYSLFAQDYFLPKSKVLYVDTSGYTRTKIARRYRIIKEGKGGISYKDLIVVTYPTEIKGLAILTWTYEDFKKDQNVWLWVPSLKKVRKISASEDDDAFMGSDLTVEDVSTRRFEDETYKLIGEKVFDGYTFEHTQEVKSKGKPCFVIEATPLKPRWYYSKRLVWVDKETGGNIYEEYYNKKGKVFKTRFIEWGWYKPETKKYPMQIAIECKDLRTGHRTVIFNEEQEYDQGISEQNFTVKALMRSRW
ncbi:MAG: outer membrane lipoprotein-sorting protein [Candidatus Omnitrophota bacterium]|nr:MAG: outer membrane lipoprotein-sorting protein [Candidatus Omnitrophota bacterium]